MALKLDILKDNKNKDSYRKYSYADVRLDLKLNSYLPNTPVGSAINSQDIELSYDEEAISNSIKNIFNTKKGQKILTPNFGLDLEQFLFENISKENGAMIGTKISEELPFFEPRIAIDKITVRARPARQEYRITLSIIIPSLNNKKTVITGAINTEGFRYI